MKRQFLLAMLTFLTLSTLSAEKYVVETGQFSKLKVNGNIRVVYRNLPDSAGFAQYEADSGNAGLFNISTKGDGSMKVEPSDSNLGDQDLPVLYLYSDFLASVESFSDKSVDIESLAPTASLNVNQVGNGSISVEGIKSTNVSAKISTGNGSIYLSGSCQNAKFQMVGAGTITADQLSAEDVSCRILGTGTIGCWAVDNLKVTGIGSTKIYYKGQPNIKKTGGGKLFEIPTEFNKKGTEVRSLNPED